MPIERLSRHIVSEIQVPGVEWKVNSSGQLCIVVDGAESVVGDAFGRMVENWKVPWAIQNALHLSTENGSYSAWDVEQASGFIYYHGNWVKPTGYEGLKPILSSKKRAGSVVYWEDFYNEEEHEVDLVFFSDRYGTENITQQVFQQAGRSPGLPTEYNPDEFVDILAEETGIVFERIE